jgi:hypothetical protein
VKPEDEIANEIKVKWKKEKKVVFTEQFLDNERLNVLIEKLDELSSET